VSVDVCIPVSQRDAGAARDLLHSIDRWWRPSRDVRVLVFGAARDCDDSPIFRNGLTVKHIGGSASAEGASGARVFEAMARHGECLTSSWTLVLSPRSLVVGELPSDLSPARWSGGIAMVRRCDQCLTLGSCTGTEAGSEVWAGDPRSLAHVPASIRGHSVYPFAWMGRRSKSLALCAELAVRTRLDQQSGIEYPGTGQVYLNWWAHQYGPTLLGPEFGLLNQCPHGSGHRAVLVHRTEGPQGEVAS
jgi:hypothetical protein